MSDNANLPRAELLEKLLEIEYFPEVKLGFKYYLEQGVQDHDLEIIQLLLGAGADPNPENNSDCHLMYLLHEYRVTKTIRGNEILVLARCLLEAGANPNRVWCNNWRAYDYAAGDRSVIEYSDLLLAYGANPRIRDKI